MTTDQIIGGLAFAGGCVLVFLTLVAMSREAAAIVAAWWRRMRGD